MGYLFDGEGSAITGQRLADTIAGIFGTGTYITALGSKMAASIKDNNTVRVADGAAVQEGRVILVAADGYDDFTIPNGTQDATTTYYIGYKISTGSDGKETAETVVSTTKTEPGSMRDGATEMYIWLYAAIQNGLILESVSQIADTVGSPVDIPYGTAEPGSSVTSMYYDQLID